MLPPDQRLNADYLPGAQVHDRLVVQHQLVLLHRGAEEDLGAHPVGGVAAHLVGEHPGPTARVGLRVVHRRIGVGEKRVDRLRRSADDDTHAGRDRDRRLPEPKGIVQRAGKPLDEQLDLVPRREVAPHDDELVAGEPRERVTGAQRGGEPSGDLDEQLVAGRVPEAVVDPFEVVEVEEPDPHFRPAALGVGQCLP